MGETANDTVQAVEPPKSVKIKPAVQQRANELALYEAEKTRRWAMENVQAYTKFTAEEAAKAANAHTQAEKDAKEWAEAWSLLVAAGFKPEEMTYPRWGIMLHVKEKQLTKLYRAVGRLDGENAVKDIEDAEAGTVRVTMPCVKYPKLRVSWVKKLTPDDKCRIVEEIVPEKKEHKLVCGVPTE